MKRLLNVNKLSEQLLWINKLKCIVGYLPVEINLLSDTLITFREQSFTYSSLFMSLRWGLKHSTIITSKDLPS